MCDKIDRWVDQGCVVNVSYLNLSKAFDMVSHRLLLEKIGALSFDRVIIGWIESFLCGRVMSVKVSGRLFSSDSVISGVHGQVNAGINCRRTIVLLLRLSSHET